MKTTRFILVGLTVAALAPAAIAEENPTDRLGFSARFGLKMSAHFESVSLPTAAASAVPRTTPNGDPYNYDNGYVGGVDGLRPDISGNEGGQTWYWGYDGAGQISENTILMSRTTTSGGSSSPSSSFSDDPQLGCELTYNRQLGVARNARYGIEVAVNYLNIDLHNTALVSGSATRVTDAYPFTPGTTPPKASPPDTSPGPYQGSIEGPGFLIGDQPVSRSTEIVPGSSVTDRQKFDGNLWGLRLGPYLEVPFKGRVNLAFSGGLAVGLLDADVSWSQTAGNSGPSGSGNDTDILWGGYVSATMLYQVDDHWGLFSGAQYQSLGTYEHRFGGRKVELDLRRSIFITVGLSYTF